MRRTVANAPGLLLGAALTFAALSMLLPLYGDLVSLLHEDVTVRAVEPGGAGRQPVAALVHVAIAACPLLLGAAAAVIAWRRSCGWLNVWILAAGGVVLGGVLEYTALAVLFVIFWL